MGTWKWKQPSGKIWTVVTGEKRIELYKEDGAPVLKEDFVLLEAVKMLETHFLDIVAEKDDGQEQPEPIFSFTEKTKKVGTDYDGLMYA